ncbi:MAG TPA: amidohydrolase family protein, partial [Longimicrobiaceae bacterium]|nr:amidohydrolase family protein [Longimicrobiaceae bacterium]
MSLRPTLYRARWVLPVATDPIAHGEVLVGEDGRIASVAPAGALERFDGLEVRDLGNAMLLPGLVNVHAHPELTMFRGALEDLQFRDWILRLVGAKRSVLGDEDALAAARWTMVELVRAGITTVAATEMTGAGAAAMGEAGVRGILYQEVFGPDPAQVEDSMRDVRAAVERLSGEAGDLVRIGISPHAPYTVSDALYSAAAAFAREAGLAMAVHIAESRAERELVVDGGGDFAPGLRARGIATPSRAASPIRLLERLGVLECRPLLIHCVDLDEGEIATIAG